MDTNRRIKRLRKIQIRHKYKGINPNADAQTDADWMEAFADDLHALTGSIPFHLQESTQLVGLESHLQVLKELAEIS